MMQSQKDAAPNLEWTDLVSSPENDSLFVDSFVEMAKRKCDAILSSKPKYNKIATGVLNFKYINSNVYIKKKIRNKSIYDSLKYSGDQLRLTKLFSLVNAKIPDNISKLIFGLSISAAERIEEKRRGDKAGKAKRLYNTSLGVSNALIALEVIGLISDYETAKQSGETDIATKSMLYVAFLLGLVSENTALRNKRQIYLIGDYARWRRLNYDEEQALTVLMKQAKIEALNYWEKHPRKHHTFVANEVWRDLKEKIPQFVDEKIPNRKKVINGLENKRFTLKKVTAHVREVAKVIGANKYHVSSGSHEQAKEVRKEINKLRDKLES